MFKEELLERSKRIQLSILKKICFNNGKISKNDLCNNLNISFPTLRSYIKEIEFLLKSNNCKNTQIICTKNYVLLKCDKHFNLDKLTSKLIENSLKFKLLKYLFEKNSLPLSTVKICNELNISKSTLNKNIIECNNILNNFDICIKNFKFIGLPIQITYFFYLLFINTRVISNDESFLLNKLVNFFYEKFGIYLNSKQKYLLNVWLFTINNGFSFFKKDYKFIKYHKENLKILNNNPFFLELIKFFEQIYLNKNLDKCLAYVTTCFLLSFNILPTDFIYKNYGFKDSKSYKIYNLIINEINELYVQPININNILKQNILSICYRFYFFKGIFYSNDYITREYYLNKFSNHSRIKFVENLLLKLHNLDGYNKSNDEFFKLVIIITLSYINGKTKNSINIGILSYNEDFVLIPKIIRLNDYLRKKFDINIEIYNKNKNYDLVISNIISNSDKLSNNYRKTYFFTNLDGEYDLNNIVEILNEIDNSVRY
ncbi:MAG: helix-turn-helix domain-containing protein [Clostridium perfringens]|uniref:helix-turn-helix domain-containing protein n=4 Tax=Clostridium perfringens TaxID=1502 RepID=UPI0007057667|nr:helix-turn-helix domain-containing protein [Clostridium perfringens]ALG48152.1 Trans-acting positive regulator [Clostridium perfringens]EJT6534524.1 helix-turn-helix domain-containing protein [Clostridium perfringens]MBI6047116.1 helix-turn-helix domain-containing protein [Clostridium perfringens]MDH2457968.1 helix-turn-helix domain-containing protein [Clostridium perfringens]MDJ8925117.1 helix-turn-helix domain-containing protein [Clostridium perfringens]